jgi:hypothetical protein
MENLYLLINTTTSTMSLPLAGEAVHLADRVKHMHVIFNNCREDSS